MGIGLYLHALRVVQPRQLTGRALRPLRRRSFPATPVPSFAPPAQLAPLWQSEAWEPSALAGTGTRLHRFHAQYGEDVLALARQGDGEAAHNVARAWIAANPPAAGDAWHPYTTSTRIANWIAAIGLQENVGSPVVVESLWRQLSFLVRNVEDDVLGNHVIRNARALLLGGISFDRAELMAQAAELFERELAEQLLADGGHYERSPTYHLVVLRDLLEARAASQGAIGADEVPRMEGFAAALARPDGAAALFNDGGLDLAPRLELPPSPHGLACFDDTGYAVLRREHVWLALDCGAPSPGFLPAHAHADALSFQLWSRGKALVVDPGTSTYEAGPRRAWERGTPAHATVAVDGDQFQTWGAFRSGPLPDIQLLEASEQRLSAQVRGRSRVRHVRRIELIGNELIVQDELHGRGRHTVESSLPLAAGVDLGVDPIGPLAAVLEPREYAERLFTRVSSTALVVRGELMLPAELGWRITIP